MDRIDTLAQEAENKLIRIHSRHQKEWDEILEESKKALSKAKTVSEVKKINREYEQKFKHLCKRQKDEFNKVNKEFKKALFSC